MKANIKRAAAYRRPRRPPTTRRKVVKLRKAPAMTPDEKEGVAIIDRAWVRLQEHGRKRDKLKANSRAQKMYLTGEVLWETMYLLKKVRGRIREGKFRA